MKRKQQAVIGLFDHIKHIITMQDKDYFSKLDESSLKTFNVFMIQRVLSMNPDWIDIIAFINKYYGVIDKEQYYKMIISLIPKQKNYFYPYAKKNKDNKYPQWLIDILVEYFNISKFESTEYIKILLEKNRKNELLDLVTKYGVDAKSIKELEKL